MKILLTARGFLGEILEQRLLEQGYDVRVMGKEKNIVNMDNFHFNNITEDMLEKLDMGIHYIAPEWTPDLIVHNASIVSSVKGIEDPRNTFETNIMGTVNVLEYAKKNRTPVLFISSCKIQPNSRGALGSYGVSKVAGEEIVQDYWKIYGVPYIILRPASIYGVSQNGVSILGWITWFIKAAIHGYKIKIENDGNQTRDSIHVQDLADLILKIIPTFYEGANEIYEVGGGEEEAISINDLVEYLKEKSGIEIRTQASPTRRGDPYSLVMDPSKTMETWDWTPKYGIWAGVDEIYGIYSKNPELYDKE